MFSVMLPRLFWEALTLTVPVKTVRAPKALAPVSSKVPPGATNVPTWTAPVKVFAPARVNVPVPTLLRPRAKPVVSAITPVKVEVALPVPTVRVPAF